MYYIDALSVRYGWSRKEILEDMYWEELVEMVVYAANESAREQNLNRKFEFMLHADKKSAGQWKDAPLPFEEDVFNNKEGRNDGTDQLPDSLKHLIYRT